MSHLSSLPPLINALLNPVRYPHLTSEIRVVETHISWLILTGEYAYKIKNPVNFGFLDFTELAQRRLFCLEELRLNQRLTANLYLEVIAIGGSPEHPELGVEPAIEYAVKMRQFASGQLLAEQAKAGNLSVLDMDEIVDQLADFHKHIAIADLNSPYGESSNIRYWFDENFSHLFPLLATWPDKAAVQQIAAIEAWGALEWQRKLALFCERKRSGFVRECHGDLHLGNMTRIDGRVILFDCIEFNPELRWIDVISDVAFLLIDLLRFGYEAYAHRVLNRYLQLTGDYQSLAVLHYYLVYRAVVRAKVALLSAQQQQNPQRIQSAHDDYGFYIHLAEHFTRSPQPQLIITHGFSGSGKSTFAEQLCEATGVIQLRSDVERKRLFGYQASQNTNGEIYSADASTQTYQHLAVLAQSVIDAGYSVLVDATFLRCAQRACFRQLAAQLNVPFSILHCDAPDEVLCQRIIQRKTEGYDASEATLDVLRLQQQNAESFTTDELPAVINANLGVSQVKNRLGLMAC